MRKRVSPSTVVKTPSLFLCTDINAHPTNSPGTVIMRFKAKLAPEQVAILANVVAPMSKLQDAHQGAILYLDPEFLRIACKSSQSGITCFAELSKSIFLEHRIESASENVIVCQVDLISLKLALQSVIAPGYHHHNQQSNKRNSQGTQPSQTMVQSLIAQQHQAVVLKLAKRNSLPCLCLDGHATEDRAVEIHQAIPIRILRATDMQFHLPPQINRPQVQLELPLDRPLRALVDKLKTMGPHGKYRICTFRHASFNMLWDSFDYTM